jgi:hypothetical protein
MPNWCTNDLSIRGSKELIEEIASTELLLSKLVPYPEELKDYQKIFPVPKNEVKARQKLKKKYGVDNLYDWCVENWGTKWEVTVTYFSVEESKNKDGSDCWLLDAAFDSAWGPPIEAFEKVYEKYKNTDISIRLDYIEPGCGFLGRAENRDGDFKNECLEYSGLSELRNILKNMDHRIGQNELEYLEEEEESNSSDSESEEDLVKVEVKKTVKVKAKSEKTASKPKAKKVKPAKKTAKSVAPVKTVKPKAVKKSAK